MSDSRTSSQAPGKLGVQKFQALRQNLEQQNSLSSSLELVMEHLQANGKQPLLSETVIHIK